MAAGTKQKDVAALIGIRPEQISRWKKQAEFRKSLDQKLAEIEDEIDRAREVLVEGAILAALRMIQGLGSHDDAVAIRAAGGILDRVGISKIQRLEHAGAEGGPIQISDVRAELERKLLQDIGPESKEGASEEPH